MASLPRLGLIEEAPRIADGFDARSAAAHRARAPRSVDPRAWPTDWICVIVSPQPPDPARLSDADPLIARAAALETSAPLEAEQAYRAAIRRQLYDVRAYERLGVLLLKRGAWSSAAACFEQLLRLDPGNLDALPRKAAAYARAGQLEAAERSWREFAWRRPELAAAHVEHGLVLMRLGSLTEADEAMRRARERAPTDPLVLYNAALLDRAFGRFEAARSALEQCIALSPDRAEAYEQLSELGALAPDGLHARHAAELLDRPLATRQRLALHFALARMFDRAGQFGAAWRHLDTAHALRQTELKAEGRAADIAGLQHQIEACAMSARRPLRIRLDPPEPVPIFIVGMPRSGSTLVERILASHPLVGTGGELTALPSLVRDASGPAAGIFGDPEALCALDDDAVHRLADRYSARLAAVDSRAAFVTDKMPFNFIHLGLIRRMFPTAPIIHCRRSAADVALSCMMTNFVTENPYLTTLNNIAAFCDAHAKIMQIWRADPASDIHEIDYEALAAAPDAEVRALFDHCGLPWTEAWRQHEARAEPVATSSATQVRQEIHVRSVGRWRDYERYAGSVLSRLDVTHPGGSV